jgi:hypothetical protein
MNGVLNCAGTKVPVYAGTYIEAHDILDALLVATG